MSAWKTVNHGPVNGVCVGRFNNGINASFAVYAYQDVLVDAGPSSQWSVAAEFITAQILIIFYSLIIMKVIQAMQII